MFRCITELKGLIIDIDSFLDIDVSAWKNVLKYYKCLFFVSSEKIYQAVVECYSERFAYKVEKFRKLFAPNHMTHEKVLNILGLRSTEVAYVSADDSFLDKAMGFLGGTIWVTDAVNYEQASKAPDLICRGFNAFERLLLENVKGFLGEVAIFPNDEIKGMIIPLQFEVDGDDIPMFMLGRYFGYAHYMNQLHPYSTAIYFNKREGKPYYRKFDNIFAELYSCAIKRIQEISKIDGVMSVPTRPGKKERFESILAMIAQNCEINNFGKHFRCIEDYPPQKNLSSQERQDNIFGVFKCEEYLHSKNIVLIDDIITTGATIKECVRTLMRSGVNQLFIVVLGINQLQGNYWSSEVAEVTCPECKSKMHLLINGRNKNFFYSCYSCGKTLNFEDGRNLLCENVNAENI